MLYPCWLIVVKPSHEHWRPSETDATHVRTYGKCAVIRDLGLSEDVPHQNSGHEFNKFLVQPAAETFSWYKDGMFHILKVADRLFIW